MTMTHPGLPQYWALIIWGFMVVLSLWALWIPVAQTGTQRTISLTRIRFLRPTIRFLTLTPWPLFFLKLLMVVIFLLIIYAGLYGTPVAERNLTTVLTWNIWWAGLVISVFFSGLLMVCSMSMGHSGNLAGQTKTLEKKQKMDRIQ